jgi:hypothetical protein
MEAFSYEIHRRMNYRSLRAALIISCFFLAAILILRFVGVSLTGVVYTIAAWALMGLLLLPYTLWLWRPWKQPFTATWHNNGVTLVNEAGEQTDIAWQDVVRIRVEGETVPNKSAVVPLEGQSLKAKFWLAQASTDADDIVFFHMDLKSGKSVLTPLPQTYIEKAVNHLTRAPLPINPQEMSAIPTLSIEYLSYVGFSGILLMLAYMFYSWLASIWQGSSALLLAGLIIIGVAAVAFVLHLAVLLFRYAVTIFRAGGLRVGESVIEGTAAYIAAVVFFILGAAIVLSIGLYVGPTLLSRMF